MASQTTLTDVVKLSEAQYATLKANGNITVGGITVPYSDTTLYLTEGVADDGSSMNSNSVVVTDNQGNTITSGVTVTELNQLDNVRSNIQKQIDDLKDLIDRANYAVYFGNTVDDIDVEQPGTYYIPSLTNPDLYDQYIVTEDQEIKLIARSIPAEQIEQQDLSAYQKKVDPTINVRNVNSGASITTVVGSINELDREMGDAWPLETNAQTVSAAINELANRTVTGDVQIDGVGVIVADITGDGYEISHKVAQAAYDTTKVIGKKVNNGCWQFPAGLRRDQYGHLSSTQATNLNMYIPLTAGTADGQVWTWDETTGTGRWGAGGTGTTVLAGTGLQLDGDVMNHLNTARTTAGALASTTLTYGGTNSIPTIKIDSTGHISVIGTQTAYPPTVKGNQYDYWASVGSGAGNGAWTAAVNDADTIVANTKPNTLVNSNAINDIMSGMKIVRMTQAAYDALSVKNPNIIYFIVG